MTWTVKFKLMGLNVPSIRIARLSFDPINISWEAKYSDKPFWMLPLFTILDTLIKWSVLTYFTFDIDIYNRPVFGYYTKKSMRFKICSFIQEANRYTCTYSLCNLYSLHLPHTEIKFLQLLCFWPHGEEFDSVIKYNT